MKDWGKCHAKLSSDEEAVTEAFASKLDVMLSKLSNLETQFEESNIAVKGLQCKVGSLEVDVDSVKAKQKTISLPQRKILHLSANN